MPSCLGSPEPSRRQLFRLPATRAASLMGVLAPLLRLGPRRVRLGKSALYRVAASCSLPTSPQCRLFQASHRLPAIYSNRSHQVVLSDRRLGQIRVASTSSAAPNEEGKEESIDPRVYRIAASSFLMGTAIGVVMPVMPMFALELGISTVQYGMLISVMGLTRLLFNIPAAMAADRFGRRPLLTGGPALSALSMWGTSMASSMSELMTMRFGTGAGGAFQMAGGQAYLSDISTPRNRARSISPMVAAFSAGAVLGPAIGGFVAESFGMRMPFLVVGTAMAGAAVNNYFLPETQPKRLTDTPVAHGSLLQGMRDTTKQWRPLLGDKNMQGALLAHMSFWFASSGVMFTLMPLAASAYDVSPSSLGSYFSIIAITNVIGAQPIAWLSDKYGRKPMIVTGCGLLASSVGMMPFIGSENHLMALVGLWAVGNTILGSTPTAYVADISTTETRSQALALLRSAGDLGILGGASVLGIVAHATNSGVAMGTASCLLLAAGANFAFRAKESVIRLARRGTVPPPDGGSKDLK